MFAKLSSSRALITRFSTLKSWLPKAEYESKNASGIVELDGELRRRLKNLIDEEDVRYDPMFPID